MFVIRLPNGNLQVPHTAIHTGDGRIIGDVYVEIGPQDADYARLAAQALTPDEVAQRKDQWRDVLGERHLAGRRGRVAVDRPEETERTDQAYHPRTVP